MNVKLVQSIKRHLAEQTSDELRQMLEERDVGRYSDEAFVAAQELLDERGRGESREPPPKPLPPPEPTPAQRAAAEEALLRRQVRLIGAYYYFVAAVILVFAPVTAYVVASVVLAVSFWFLGWSLRRFSPAARMAALILSMIQWPVFPIGTIIGLYCFDKLTRADRLFGGKGHPGERVAEPRRG